MTTVVTLLAIILTALAAAPAAAEQVEITVPPPERAREPVIVPPGDHYQVTRPSDADYYPQSPRVRHDPTFVGPLSGKVETPTATGRAGVAGWTSPNAPVGPAQVHREVTGWFAFGFAFEWGGPPPPAKRSPR